MKSNIKLLHPIKVEDSKYAVKRSVVVALMKEDVDTKWTHLLEQKNKPNWLKVDWSRFEDSDEEGLAGMDGMDWNQGGMPGMAGMGGMPGMPGGGDFDMSKMEEMIKSMGGGAGGEGMPDMSEMMAKMGAGGEGVPDMGAEEVEAEEE